MQFWRLFVNVTVNEHFIGIAQDKKAFQQDVVALQVGM